MVITDLHDTVYVPTIGNEIVRSTFDTQGPPFASYYFKKRVDAENWIEFCEEKYPGSKYEIIEYKLSKQA